MHTRNMNIGYGEWDSISSNLWNYEMNSESSLMTITVILGWWDTSTHSDKIIRFFSQLYQYSQYTHTHVPAWRLYLYCKVSECVFYVLIKIMSIKV